MGDISGVFPLLRRWPEAVNDIETVPQTATELRLVSGARGFGYLKHLSLLSDLLCFDVNPEKLSGILECQGLRRLFIEGVKCKSLTEFSNIDGLEVLSLAQCSTVQGLAGLEKCQGLRGLGIINFKNVRSIVEIGELVRLTELAVSGGMWTRMNIETLKPLAALVALENIDLSNTKVRDESLRPLGNLRNLKALNVANFYPMEEFAWLSKRLRNTKCTWFSPFVEFPIGVCKACGSNTMVMLTGKGKPMLCTRCDAKRLDQHVEAFSRAGNQ